jgi:DNA-binding SARP family transcriptional activator/TolB-like protein/Tfp pilus assembly protein PilF
MKPRTCIRLRLLGRLAISFADQPDPIRLSTRKSGALLAYLATSPEQTARREELAALLWGGCSDQQARQSLRQALALLRKELRWPQFLSADTEVVRLQPGLWSVDAIDFERLSRSSDPGDLDQAARLFGGEFLSGLNIDEEGFDEWVRGQRQRVQIAAARLCETLASRPDLVSDGQQAVGAVERLMALDPLREDWQRLALTLYARYRGKNEALSQAEVFAAVLPRELGVAAEEETRALLERIRADEFGMVPHAAPGLLPGETANEKHSAPTTPDQRPAPDRSSSPARQRWTPLRKHPSLGTAAVALIAVIVLGGGFLGLGASHTGSDFPDPPKNLAAPANQTDRSQPPLDSSASAPKGITLAPADDPWQPPAPAGPAAEKAALMQPSGITAILVLPFTNVGEPGEQSALSADLITDDLTNALSRAAGFRVISRQTAMSYRGQQVDPAAVGIELGVHYVLEGTVETQGSGLSANVELIETKGRSRVWSGRYDRAGPDRLMILDDIARSVGRELQINVTRAEGAVTAQDPDVRALIYKGFSAIADAGRLGQPALQQSEKYFTQALAREPDNPRAQTGLGMYHVQMAANLYAPDPAPHLTKAEAILQQVIERHPGVGGPYRLMGVLNIARGRPEIAAQWFQREIEINPSDAPSYAQLGRTMVMRGHPAEGIKYILYAMRLSPRDQAMAFWLGMAGLAELEQGHDQTAIAYLERQLALKPGHARALIVLAAIHALSGNTDAARSRLEELRRTLPHLSDEKLVERYFGESDGVELQRLREGLRLAVSIPRRRPAP